MSKDRIQAEALAALKDQKRGGLGITMGGGKTLIGLRHMEAIYESGDRFLVVAPKRSIFKSWESTAKKFGLHHLSLAIHYCTYLSLSKQSFDFKAIYLDECHSLLYSHEAWLQQYEGRIIGLTGTPPRFLMSEKGQMVKRFCPIVYTYLTDAAIDEGILNDYRIVIHHLNLSEKNTVKMINPRSGQEWYTSERESYLYWHKRIEKDKHILSFKQRERLHLQRMRVLMGFETKMNYTKQLLQRIETKVIVFANTQKQAEELCPYSYHRGNKESEKNLRLFTSGMIGCLSSVMQLNEGINIPGLQEGIILHAYSNERKTAQRIGRLLRLSPHQVATAHILCYDGTVDEEWIEDALHDFDKGKVFHYYPKKKMVYNYYGLQAEGMLESRTC